MKKEDLARETQGAHSPEVKSFTLEMLLREDYIASPEAGWTNGITLEVNGGIHLSYLTKDEEDYITEGTKGR